MKPDDEPGRAARLAARLRENLHRRKAQARSRGSAAGGDESISGPALPESTDGG